MNNNFRIIFIKINIIKFNIVKLYTKITHFITKNVTLAESPSKKSISWLANKASSCVLITILVTNQSGTSFNAGTKSSTVLSHISWIFCLLRQYFSIKGFLETTLLHISWVFRNRVKNKRTSINSSNTHFLDLILVRNELYCRRIRIDSFIARFLSHIRIENKFLCMSIFINCFITHFLILVAVWNKNWCSTIF